MDNWTRLEVPVSLPGTTAPWINQALNFSPPSKFRLKRLHCAAFGNQKAFLKQKCHIYLVKGLRRHFMAGCPMKFAGFFSRDTIQRITTSIETVSAQRLEPLPWDGTYIASGSNRPGVRLVGLANTRSGVPMVTNRTPHQPTSMC